MKRKRENDNNYNKWEERGKGGKNQQDGGGRYSKRGVHKLGKEKG